MNSLLLETLARLFSFGETEIHLNVLQCYLKVFTIIHILCKYGMCFSFHGIQLSGILVFLYSWTAMFCYCTSLEANHNLHGCKFSQMSSNP